MDEDKLKVWCITITINWAKHLIEVHKGTNKHFATGSFSGPQKIKKKKAFVSIEKTNNSKSTIRLRWIATQSEKVWLLGQTWTQALGEGILCGPGPQWI